jgi:dTDP-glucose 4,6-dehydratase
VFGPGQQLYRIIPRTILSVLLGRKLPLHGGGHSLRSFIHIRDVVAGTLAAARLADPPEIFHFATQRLISIRELVQMICERMGVSLGDVVEIAEDRAGKDKAYVLDTTKARKQLSWADKVALETGIDETIAWTRTHLKELRGQPQSYEHKP